jgi:hypothetical protein
MIVYAYFSIDELIAEFATSTLLFYRNLSTTGQFLNELYAIFAF